MAGMGGGFAALVGLGQVALGATVAQYLGVYQISEGGWLIASGLFTLAATFLFVYRVYRVSKWLKRSLGGKWR
jgi:hypothetical protein